MKYPYTDGSVNLLLNMIVEKRKTGEYYNDRFTITGVSSERDEVYIEGEWISTRELFNNYQTLDKTMIGLDG